MQRLTLEVQDEFMPKILAFLNSLPKQSCKVKQKSVNKPMLNDLSKFTPRNDLVVGNSDDLVNINW